MTKLPVPEVMNIRQCAQYLGISTDTLYQYVVQNSIPAFKLGNRWRFKKDILDAWIAGKCAQQSTNGSTAALMGK